MKALGCLTAIAILGFIILVTVGVMLFVKAATPSTMDAGEAVQQHCYQNPGSCEDAILYGE